MNENLSIIKVQKLMKNGQQMAVENASFYYTSIGLECGFFTLALPMGFDDKGLPSGTYFFSPQLEREWPD